MKGYSFEVHMYAPELNKCFLNGKHMLLPSYVVQNFTAIRDDNIRLVRKYLKKPTGQKGYKVKFICPNPSNSRTYSGTVDSYEHLKRFLKMTKAKHNQKGTKIKLMPYWV